MCYNRLRRYFEPGQKMALSDTLTQIFHHQERSITIPESNSDDEDTSMRYARNTYEEHNDSLMNPRSLDMYDILTEEKVQKMIDEQISNSLTKKIEKAFGQLRNLCEPITGARARIVDMTKLMTIPIRAMLNQTANGPSPITATTYAEILANRVVSDAAIRRKISREVIWRPKAPKHPPVLKAIYVTNIVRNLMMKYAQLFP
ncbi:hypothetical protein BDF22DRAFT_747894 [Syncephalis plumigaleata]|nr:hypothetical protein BDF22DRAFT_747894 [Syncephalis plumigaleata]